MRSQTLRSLQLRILFGLLVCTLGACTQMRVRSEFDPQADFSRLSTYAWLPGMDPTNDPRLDTKLLDTRVRETVERHLATKGFRKVDDTSPSFFVAYHVYLRKQTEDLTRPVGPYGYRWWGMGPPRTLQYDEGSLLVDFVDPASNALMWRGASSATVDYHASVAERTQRIDEAVGALLEKFPPTTK